MHMFCHSSESSSTFGNYIKAAYLIPNQENKHRVTDYNNDIDDCIFDYQV